MFHVVQILLHRPFVSYGHLQSVLPEVAIDSFSICAAAANCIAQYLESYNHVHSFKFAPFFLFYASYVSATIHVRIAAQRHLNSDAFACLRMCLSVFDQNELNNPAVKKAKAVIQKLMDRMGVKLPDTHSSTTATMPMPTPKDSCSAPTLKEVDSEENFKNLATPIATPHMDLLQGWGFSDLDFDAILQSFGRPNPSVGNSAVPKNNFVRSPEMMNQSIPWSTFGMNQASSGPFDYVNQFGIGSMDDVLFGFDVSSKEDDW